MNEIQIFSHEEFGEIRTIEIDGQVYFALMLLKLLVIKIQAMLFAKELKNIIEKRQ